ncbi:MAG: GrpB family protein [Dysgonomonas sp.]|nr:GrpB family protein [Dysgonomonas sp.]
MKIHIEKYNIKWRQDFEAIKEDLESLIGFLHPQIEHVGSTSVEGLSAKPIIDILVGLECKEDLDRVITPLMDNDYIYYEIYNQYMPDRRFFVKHKVDLQTLSLPNIFREDDEVPTDTNEHNSRLAHIHVWPKDSDNWIRHIAFRDYLRSHPVVKNEYQKLKERLSLQEWKDGNEYNEAKDSFIKTEERKAIDWYYNTRI